MSGAWRGRPDIDWLRPKADRLREIEEQYRPPGAKASPKKATKPQVLQAIKDAVDASANPPSVVQLDAVFGIGHIPRANPLPPLPVPGGKQVPPPGKQTPPVPPGTNVPSPGKQVPPVPPGTQVPSVLPGKLVPPVPPGKQVPPPGKQAPPVQSGKQVPSVPPGKLVPPPGEQTPPVPPGTNVPPTGKQAPPVPPGKHVPPTTIPPGGNPANWSDLQPLPHHLPVSIQNSLREAIRNVWGNTSQDALQLNATNALQVSRLGMQTANFETVGGLVNAGRFFPHRGRGPTWLDNSCALDCCIVVAMFMNVGTTVIDMGSANSRNHVPRIQREFVAVVNENWDFLAGPPSQRRRNAFLRSVLASLNHGRPPQSHLRLGQFLSATAMWDQCASAFQQFTYSEDRRRNCRTCSGSRELNPQSGHSRVLLDGLGSQFGGQTPTMQQLLARHFGVDDSRACSFNCRDRPLPAADRRRRVYGGLPPRLVVQPADDYRDIRQATADNITFQYQDDKGNENDVTYRWLGGVYQHALHYRTYWTDGGTLASGGDIKIYDGQVTEGSIIGGIPAARSSNRVPASWANGTDILFYERVVRPDLETVLRQARTILTSFQNGLPTPTGTPGSAGGPVTPVTPISNTPQQPTGQITPNTASGTGVVGPSMKTTRLKRGPPSEEEEEKPRKRQQLDPESAPSKVSPTQRSRKTARTSPKASKSPKGKGTAVSRPKFTSPNYQGRTRSSRSTTAIPSPKSKRKKLASPKVKRKRPAS